MKKIVTLLLLLLTILSGCDPYVPTMAPTSSTAAPVPNITAPTQPPQTTAPAKPTIPPSSAPTESQPHVHSYFAEVMAPVCTAEGYTIHTCICGDSFTDSYVDALGHDWGQWQTTEAATTEKEGVQRRECTRCDAFETQSLPKLEPEHIHAYADSVVKPTCTDAGYTNYICACGDSFTDSHVDALGHSWGQWVTTKEPTTDAEGEQTRTCDRCGATDHQTINRLPPVHTHEYKKSRVAVSCTESGYTLYTCQCGDSYREETSQPKGHTWDDWAVSIRPTASSAGQLMRSCSVCETLETQQTERLPAENGFIFVLLPGTVGRNEKATVAIIGQAGVTYDIDVYYKSGESSAKGLEDQIADADGFVSWTWKVGASTAAGTYRIVVTGGGETQTVYFTVEV